MPADILGSMHNRSGSLQAVLVLPDDVVVNCSLFSELLANDPRNYMSMQCLTGYAGNLCATCADANGVTYASKTLKPSMHYCMV